MAIAVGWLMTGGGARTCPLRRAALRAVTRLPGVEEKALTAAWPAFRDGPLTAPADRLAGRLCPQPRIRTPRGEVLLDESLGDGFAVITRSRPPPRRSTQPPGLLRRPGHPRCLPARRSAADVDGALTGLLDRGGPTRCCCDPTGSSPPVPIAPTCAVGESCSSPPASTREELS